MQNWYQSFERGKITISGEGGKSVLKKKKSMVGNEIMKGRVEHAYFETHRLNYQMYILKVDSLCY